MLAEDETHLDQLAKVRACWMIHRTRHQIPTPGTNIRRTVFGAVNLLTAPCTTHRRQRRLRSVLLLPRPAPARLQAPVVAVICDNGAIHTSAITQRWLAEHPRLLLLRGSRYSPQDNPTERVWAALKAWIANTAHATMPDRVRQAHAYFRARTPTQMLTTTAPWTSPWLPDGYGQDLWTHASGGPTRSS